MDTLSVLGFVGCGIGLVLSLRRRRLSFAYFPWLGDVCVDVQDEDGISTLNAAIINLCLPETGKSSDTSGKIAIGELGAGNGTRLEYLKTHAVVKTVRVEFNSGAKNLGLDCVCTWYPGLFWTRVDDKVRFVQDCFQQLLDFHSGTLYLEDFIREDDIDEFIMTLSKSLQVKYVLLGDDEGTRWRHVMFGKLRKTSFNKLLEPENMRVRGIRIMCSIPSPGKKKYKADQIRKMDQDRYVRSASVCYKEGINGKQVLLVRRRDKIPTDAEETGMWSLPGGGVDPGETPELAAVREAKEEAGIIGTIDMKATLEPILFTGRSGTGSKTYPFLIKVSSELDSALWIESLLRTRRWVDLTQRNIENLCSKDRDKQILAEVNEHFSKCK